MGAIVKEDEGEAAPGGARGGGGGGGSVAGTEGGKWTVEAVDGERHEFQTGDTIRYYLYVPSTPRPSVYGKMGAWLGPWVGSRRQV